MLALDSSSKLASALLQYQLDKLPIDYIEKRNAIVDAVTLDDAKTPPSACGARACSP
jgi:zinc protease